MLPKTDAAKYAAAHGNTTLLPNGKIRFDQTGMEFPSSVTSSILDAYAKGKAFRRAVARRANEAYDFSVHEPYILPHRNRDERHFLYCTLTKATLPRDHEVVQTHVSARRFRRRLAEVEEARKNQQALDQERRETRERAALSRKSPGEEQEQPAPEESAEEADDHMDEDNDILDGIISDDDSVNSNDDAVESPSPEHPAKLREENSRAGHLNGGAMDEGVAEEKDAFWTRGRKGAVLNEDDDNDDDEWGQSSKKSSRKEQSRSGAKKKVRTESAEKTVDVGSGIPSDPEKEAAVTGKRNRAEAQVPKKVRRARQRRKSTKQVEA